MDALFFPSVSDPSGDASSTTNVEPEHGTTATPPGAGHAGWPRALLFGLVALGTVGADLGTKHWAERALAAGSESITDALRFRLSKNPGGVASFLRDAPDAFRIPFFFAATALAIVAMVHFWRKLGGSETSTRLALALLLGGALGNLVDRVRYGYVIDFIDVHAAWRGSDVHWPTFNVADVAICAGAMLLALARLHQSRGRVWGRA